MLYVHKDIAVSIENVKFIKITENEGKSTIRFNVFIEYLGGGSAFIRWLEREEAKEVFNNIVKAVNEKKGE